jgi:hypothetical protein
MARTPKPQPLVTKETLQQMIQLAANRAEQKKIVGRALVALYQRQTPSEQSSETTKDSNSIGFSSADADVGSRCAKYFLQHQTLLDWMYGVWMQAGKGGYPRICRYSRQLNEIAEEKAARKRTLMQRRLEELKVTYGECVDSDDPSILQPIVDEMRSLEDRLGVSPYIIIGAVV